MPHAARTRSITSGLSGSPAPISSRSTGFQAAKSSWISRRQTVGGAHSVVTPARHSTSSTARASKRAAL